MTTDDGDAIVADATAVSKLESMTAPESASPALPRTPLLVAAAVVAATLVVGVSVGLIGEPGEPGPAEVAHDMRPSALSELDPQADPYDHGGASRAALAAREVRRLDELEAAVGVLAGELAETRRETRSHETDPRETLARLAARLDEVEGSARALNEQAAALEEKLGGVVKRVDDLAAAIGSLRAARKKAWVAKPPKRSPAPPFLVEAIDQWDGVAYAVVSQGGEPDFLRVGQVRSGWRLTAIDTTARTVELVDARGRAHLHRLTKR